MHRFLLTRPSRDVTNTEARGWEVEGFLLTRPSRDVTDGRVAGFSYEKISTHTPLAGRDGDLTSGTESENNFYSHAPRGT